MVAKKRNLESLAKDAKRRAEDFERRVSDGKYQYLPAGIWHLLRGYTCSATYTGRPVLMLYFPGKVSRYPVSKYVCLFFFVLVTDCLGRFVPEMTYYVSCGMLKLAKLKL